MNPLDELAELHQRNACRAPSPDRAPPPAEVALDHQALARALEAARLDRLGLARELETPLNALQAVLASPPGQLWRRRIARVLGVSPWDLWHDVGGAR